MATQLTLAFPVEPLRPQRHIPMPSEVRVSPEKPGLKPATTTPFSIDALAERLVRFHKHRGLELFIEWKKDAA